MNGLWRETGEKYCIVNVYTPCNLREKILLWDRISLVVGQRDEVYTCVIGDFNLTLHARERVGVGEEEAGRGRSEFMHNC